MHGLIDVRRKIARRGRISCMKTLSRPWSKKPSRGKPIVRRSMHFLMCPRLSRERTWRLGPIWQSYWIPRGKRRWAGFGGPAELGCSGWTVLLPMVGIGAVVGAAAGPATTAVVAVATMVVRGIPGFKIFRIFNGGRFGSSNESGIMRGKSFFVVRMLFQF